MRYCTVGETITETTRSIVVMQLSAHLFKTAGASTAAVYGGDNPHLASAILHHKNALITEQNYSSSKSYDDMRSTHAYLVGFRLGDIDINAFFFETIELYRLPCGRGEACS